MFGWVHKKKITKLAEAARAFVDANYKELPKNSTRTSEGVRYSRRLNNTFDAGIEVVHITMKYAS